MIKSKCPAAQAKSSWSRVFKVWYAPKDTASRALLSLDVNAVTSQPHAFKNCSAKCPKPPMPITATLSVGLISNWTKGLKTVMPAQNKGPAEARLIPSGMTTRLLVSARTFSAKPPWCPTRVP